jgi:beta-phosphoglucomutase family hydrolase
MKLFAPAWSDARALLFDLDGVLTPTGSVHQDAWKQTMSAYLDHHGHPLPYTDRDYFAHIDGKPRFDAVRDLLNSRNIQLPENDPAGESVQSLGNRKNAVFQHLLRTKGVEAYAGSVAFIEAALLLGQRIAVVSSSRNAPAVLKAAGLDRYFTVVVDGTVADKEGLPGKPHPATFDYAAKLLNVPSWHCAILEDAESGVQAGRSGRFHSIIGVDRGAGAPQLLAAGASYVVNDLSELL